MAEGPTYISLNPVNFITITLIAFFGMALAGAVVSATRTMRAKVSD